MVDFITHPYRSTFVYEPGGSTFDAQWFFANEGAADLGIPTAFGRAVFDPYRLLTPKIGEIWQYNARRVVGFLPGWILGKHRCGTDGEWLNGFPGPTGSAPTWPDGVPKCCQDPADPAAFTTGFDFGFDS